MSYEDTRWRKVDRSESVDVLLKTLRKKFPGESVEFRQDTRHGLDNDGKEYSVESYSIDVGSATGRGSDAESTIDDLMKHMQEEALVERGTQNVLDSLRDLPEEHRGLALMRAQNKYRW